MTSTPERQPPPAGSVSTTRSGHVTDSAKTRRVNIGSCRRPEQPPCTGSHLTLPQAARMSQLRTSRNTKTKVAQRLPPTRTLPHQTWGEATAFLPGAYGRRWYQRPRVVPGFFLRTVTLLFHVWHLRLQKTSRQWERSLACAIYAEFIASFLPNKYAMSFARHCVLNPHVGEISQVLCEKRVLRGGGVGFEPYWSVSKQ